MVSARAVTGVEGDVVMQEVAVGAGDAGVGSSMVAYSAGGLDARANEPLWLCVVGVEWIRKPGRSGGRFCVFQRRLGNAFHSRGRHKLFDFAGTRKRTCHIFS